MPPFLQQVGSVVDRMENSAHIMVHFNSMHSYLFEGIPSGDDIKSRLSMEENIPAELFLLHVDGCLLGNEDIVNIHGSSVVVVRASIAGGLQGGKGGFGAMLRALAKQQGTKTTTDFGACRDLSGRRLRHVNDEKILQKWKEAKDKGEDFDVDEETPSGIEMWYLGAPSWAAGIKSNPQKKFLKPRRKTSICMDWVRSRKDRKAPEGAPAHWGCPRGRRCVFAHGDEELKGQAATLMEEEKLNGKNAESNRKRDAYVSSISQQGEDDSLSNMVLQGMRAQKKARPENGDGFGMKKTAEVAAPILSIEGMDFPGYDAADAVQVEPVMLPSVVISAPVVSAPVISTPVMLPVKKVKQSPAWVRNVSGELTLTNEGEVESESEFATAAVNCKIREGKWYYEVELLTAGLMQVMNERIMQGSSHTGHNTLSLYSYIQS